MPKFMVHDRWANVLFLHWSVPPDLEPLLQSNCGDFALDRAPLTLAASGGKVRDGTSSNRSSAWVGMVLLTEHNVGPPYLRSSLTCVTHHGVNVRTYVRGVSGKGNEKRTRGIHFASLECDDRFTSFGANIFGMPYQVASINRRYVYSLGIGRRKAEEDGESSSNNDHNEQRQLLQHFTSTKERDDFVCAKGGDTNRRMQKFQLSSVRSPKESSLFNLLSSLMYPEARKLHGTDLIERPASSKSGRSKQATKEGFVDDNDETKQPSYTVECEWERCPEERVEEDPELVKFFVERYFVYTHKYGMNWRGEVEHEPWPVEKARLKNLTISHIHRYLPTTMQPLISHMANTHPDSVLFSPGVGPIEFNMLRPV